MEASDLLKFVGGLAAGLVVGYLAGSRSKGASAETRPAIGADVPKLSPDKVVEILTSLSETHRSIHEERIKRELQVVLATLGFFGATLALKYSATGLPNNTPFRISIWIGFLGLATGAFVYLWNSRNANIINQKAAEVTEDLLGDLLKERGGITNFRRPDGHPAKLRWLWEFLMIGFGGVLAAYLITCT